MTIGAAAGISDEARDMLEQLLLETPPLPDPADMTSYRESTRAGFAPWAEQALAQFDGDIVPVEINGIPCRQLTPPNWSGTGGTCIQYAYGGGYISGSSYEDMIIAAPLAQQSGARIVMVDYRLSPEHPYPQPQQDVQQVYPALLETYGASRLVVCGESAGGNQALGLLQHARDRDLQLPSCAVLLSPWCDLGNDGDSHEFNDPRDPTLKQDYLQLASKLHADGQDLKDPGISPLFGDMQGLPPCLITSGSRDLLLSQCLRLARKLRDAAVPCDLRVWEGMWHVFEFYPLPEARHSISEIAEFIKSHN